MLKVNSMLVKASEEDFGRATNITSRWREEQRREDAFRAETRNKNPAR
jgi:hypothetical protein